MQEQLMWLPGGFPVCCCEREGHSGPAYISAPDMVVGVRADHELCQREAGVDFVSTTKFTVISNVGSMLGQ